jgi:hypothetical protein
MTPNFNEKMHTTYGTEARIALHLEWVGATLRSAVNNLGSSSQQLRGLFLLLVEGIRACLAVSLQALKGTESAHQDKSSMQSELCDSNCKQ